MSRGQPAGETDRVASHNRPKDQAGQLRPPVRETDSCGSHLHAETEGPYVDKAVEVVDACWESRGAAHALDSLIGLMFASPVRDGRT